MSFAKTANCAQNTSGDSRISVFKHIGKQILPDLFSLDPGTVSDRLKGQLERYCNRLFLILFYSELKNTIGLQRHTRNTLGDYREPARVSITTNGSSDMRNSSSTSLVMVPTRPLQLLRLIYGVSSVISFCLYDISNCIIIRTN
jgi:hypothetical protein